MTDPCTRRSLAAWIRPCGLALLIASTIAPAANAQCEGWLSGFGLPGVDGVVSSLSSHDDGHGPALYLGGNFRIAGDITASRIVRWDGASWSRLDAGLEFAPRSLVWFDDGSGPALYAGGGPSFTQGRLARWNGTIWSELGPFDGPVHTLQVHDDGSGPALYVGGFFTHAGGVAANNIARWDGTSWTPLGAGMDSAVVAFAIFDDGTGPALHAGGSFTTAGGIPAKGVARWTGASWSPLGPGATDQVRCLAVFDDGSGPALFVGEHYINAAGGSGMLEKWNGASWSSVASFVGGASPSTASFAVHDDGSGPALYVGGIFGAVVDAATATTVPAQGIARWDGASWSGLADGFSGGIVGALVVHDGGSGPALFAGGSFAFTGNHRVPGVARWSSSSWSALDARNDGLSPHPAPLGARVAALHVFDDGSGSALYAGGSFAGAGHIGASGIARWDGAQWSAVGPASSNSFASLASFDDGGGPVLYAGGYFPVPGAPSASGLARWDGVSWVVTGGALPADDLSLYGSSGALGGLYVGGGFTIPGVTGARRIARWSGTSWSPLASGIDNGVNYTARVETITEWNASLVVAGRFHGASGVAVRNIALWNGTSWSTLGHGVDERVRALAVFDDGGGPALYAAGDFLHAGGVPAARIARWDGTSWSPVAGGVDGIVRALCVHDDGQGRALYAAGDFHAAGGAPARRIARFDGTSWSALGHGLSGNQYPSPGEVDALATFDDGLGGGAKLCAGGTFTLADDKPSARFAIWSGCASPAPLSFCTGDEDELACPCANPGSPGHGCANGSHASGAKLEIRRARSGDALEVEAEHLPPATIAVVVTSTAARAPVAFGRGLSCTGVVLRRRVVATAGGALSVQLSDSTSDEAALSEPNTRGALVYQVLYRDPATPACPASSGTWNATNAVELRR